MPPFQDFAHSFAAPSTASASSTSPASPTAAPRRRVPHAAWGGALLAALALATPAAAAPVSERPQFRTDGSVHVAGQVFATLSDYYRSDAFRSGRSCIAKRTPAREATLLPAVSADDCTNAITKINPDYYTDTVFVIQLVFHVIKQRNGTGDISEKRIRDQIDVLNEDFNALPGTLGAMSTNARVKFVLARFDPRGNPTPGYEVITNDDFFTDEDVSPHPMKTALNWDPTRYLNIYTNDAAGYLGYSTLPADSAGEAEDGIVMAHQTIGRNVLNAAPFDLGRTLTHEVGHYLGLLHTFHEGCGDATTPFTTGDLIEDTPQEAEPNSGCTPRLSVCGGGQLNPIENFMDYSDDACLTKFTRQQTNRIRCSIINYRVLNTAPAADFTFASSGDSVAFLGDGRDSETASANLRYQWDFGDGQTSTERSPKHRYSADGTYSVTLEVIDPGSASSKSVQPIVVAGGLPGKPQGLPDGPAVAGGCASGQGGLAALPLLGLALALRRRRRSR